MTEPSEPEWASDLRRSIRDNLAIGLYDWDEICRRTVEEADADPAGGLDERVAALVAREWPLVRAAQLDWPAVTDCDRLDAAFAELRTAGLIAWQDFSCCQTCGITEIRPQVDKRRARGYVFFHHQDAQSVAAGSNLYLSFGGDDPLTVGGEVVAALGRHGLVTRWDGTVGRRLHVRMVWQRRIGPLPTVYATSAAGRRVSDPSDGLLRELINDIRAGYEEFVILEKPISGSRQVYAQVTLDEGDFVVEHRDGHSDRHYQAHHADPAVAIAALIGWARDRDGWSDALQWHRLVLD